jgi:transcriptional regulator with XRE-family HTH domain
MTIGARLKEWRALKKLGQKEASSISGVSFSTYQNYEMDISPPGAKSLTGFIKAGINANWLMTGEGPMLLEDAKQLPPGLRIEIDKVLAEGGDPEAAIRQDAATHKLCAEYQAAQALLESIVSEVGVTLPKKTFDSFKTLLWLSDGEENTLAKAAIMELATYINKQTAPVPTSPIDYALLQNLIEMLEKALSKRRLVLEPARKAAAIQIMYEYCMLDETQATPATVERFLKLVA